MKKVKKVLIIILLGFIMLNISTILTYANDDLVVLIDPGHGGIKDSGAVCGDLKETNVTWKIANKLIQYLNNSNGIKAVISRSENDCPTLEQRGESARMIGADLVVSLHINSSNNINARGSEVYVTRNTRIKRFYENSNYLARDILNNLKELGIPKNGSDDAKTRKTQEGTIYSDGTYTDYYGIIKYPMNYGIPCALIEHCFISNQYDRTFISDDAKIGEIAREDAKAIIKNKDLFKIDRSKNSVKGLLDNMYYDNNTGNLKGVVLYNEVINDMVADCAPNIRIISTDGKIKKYGIVNKTSSYHYEFEINIMELDLNRQYKLQVETKCEKSIPENSYLDLNLKDQRLGRLYGVDFYSNKNLIKFDIPQYDGYMTNSPYGVAKIENNELIGKLVIQEWLNGTKQIEPTTLPRIVLKTETGTQIEGKLKKLEPYLYEYRFEISQIDTSQEYEMEVICTNSNNISNHKNVVVEYGNIEINGIRIK